MVLSHAKTLRAGTPSKVTSAKYSGGDATGLYRSVVSTTIVTVSPPPTVPRCGAIETTLIGNVEASVERGASRERPSRSERFMIFVRVGRGWRWGTPSPEY